MLKMINRGPFLKQTIKIGRAMALRIEATEIILTKMKTKNQVSMVNPNIAFKLGVIIARPNSAPKVVAMPFPPLKFKNIVQLCPQTQASPIMI